jgi:hypothetical protein
MAQGNASVCKESRKGFASIRGWGYVRQRPSGQRRYNMMPAFPPGKRLRTRQANAQQNTEKDYGFAYAKLPGGGISNAAIKESPQTTLLSKPAEQR